MWCLCLLLLLMIKNGYGIVVNRVTGSLIEYSFNRLDCLNGDYLDVTRSSNVYIGSILPISSTCSSYNAMWSKGSSSKNITTMIPQLETMPITIEFWIGIEITNLASNNIVEILSIGKIDGSAYNMKVI